MTQRRVSTRLVLPAMAATVMVLVAGPAFAHVTVNPNTAEQGGDAELTFRVPNESDKASTSKIEVYFPTDTPIPSVLVKAQVGWTYKIVDQQLSTPITTDDGQVTQAVSEIVWTAQNGYAIKPGEYDDFNVSVEGLPDADSVTFKALQYYSDGSIVRWIDQSVAGQPEPEHPAPVLTLTPADASTGSATGDTGSATGDTGSTSSSDKGPWVISIVALVVGILGGGAALLRRK